MNSYSSNVSKFSLNNGISRRQSALLCNCLTGRHLVVI